MREPVHTEPTQPVPEWHGAGRPRSDRLRRAVVPAVVAAMVVAGLVVAVVRRSDDSIRRAASGQGYWLLAADGGLFALDTVSNPGTVNTGFNAIHLDNGIVGTDTLTACVDVRSNSISGGGKGTTLPNNNDLRLQQRQSTTVRLPGYAGAAFDPSAVATFEAGQNTVSTSTASTGAGGGFTGGAACAQPPA